VMKENKLLIAILVILTISVLTTVGLTAYLTLNHAQEENSAETSAEQALEESLLAEQENTTPIGPRIAYVSNRDNDGAIYTINPDGSDRQLISSPDLAFSWYPSWSPDGQRVAYIGSRETIFGTDGVPIGIWVSAGDGSSHIQVDHNISNTIFAQPTWSPDGTRLAFASWAQGEGESEPHSVIHIAMADGSSIERELSFPLEIRELWWSPVQDELLIISGDPESGTHVHVMSSDGSEITEIYRGSITASWSPHGEAVAVGNYTSLEILIIDLSQDDQNPTVRSIGQLAMQPIEVVWSPSGDHVAIASSGHYRQGYSTNLHIIAVESGETTVVADSDGWVGWPRWSPDGQILIFTWGELIRTPALPISDLWTYDVVSGELEERAIGDGFEGVGVWSP
jgi:Tol biopolymer transport system component